MENLYYDENNLCVSIDTLEIKNKKNISDSLVTEKYNMLMKFYLTLKKDCRLLDDSVDLMKNVSHLGKG